MKYRYVSAAAALLIMLSATGCAGNLANNASRFNNGTGTTNGITRNHDTNRTTRHRAGNRVANNLNRTATNANTVDTGINGNAANGRINGGQALNNHTRTNTAGTTRHNQHNATNAHRNNANTTTGRGAHLANNLNHTTNRGVTQGYINEGINNDIAQRFNTHNPTTSGAYRQPNAINHTIYNEGNAMPEFNQTNTVGLNNNATQRAARRRQNATNQATPTNPNNTPNTAPNQNQTPRANPTRVNQTRVNSGARQINAANQINGTIPR